MNCSSFHTISRCQLFAERYALYLGFDYVDEQSVLEHKHTVRFVVDVRAWY